VKNDRYGYEFILRGFLCFKEDDDDEDYRGVQNYNVPEQDRLRQVKLFFIKKE
jgi:hypothetical protein